MPNYEITKKGSHFTDERVSFSWAINHDRSEVVSIDEADQTSRFKQAVLNGRLRVTTRAATVSKPLDQPTRKLMTGQEARDYKAIPAGPVYRWAYDPSTGGRVQVPIQVAKGTFASPAQPEPNTQPADEVPVDEPVVEAEPAAEPDAPADEAPAPEPKPKRTSSRTKSGS